VAKAASRVARISAVFMAEKMWSGKVALGGVGDGGKISTARWVSNKSLYLYKFEGLVEVGTVTV